MSSFVAWFTSAIIYGTVIMFCALGENITEKAGHLNLGVPGMMYIGASAGFVSGFLYEKSANHNQVLMIILPIVVSFIVAALGGLLYSFFTVTLRANQNVTGLALTALGAGLGSFGSYFVLRQAGYTSYAKAGATSELFRANLNSVLGLGNIGEMFLSYGFLTYVAIVLAIILHFFLKKTRTGLNLRAIGENPATADAAGINVSRYKYLATTIGGGICGLGGLYYIMVFKSGGWTTENSIEALGWLAVALVIFSTWRPLNIIWGSYLFAFLFWLYNFLPSVAKINFTTPVSDLVQMLPYVITVLMLIFTSMRKKRENQPPQSLGLSYFREDR